MSNFEFEFHVKIHWKMVYLGCSWSFLGNQTCFKRQLETWCENWPLFFRAFSATFLFRTDVAFATRRPRPPRGPTTTGRTGSPARSHSKWQTCWEGRRNRTARTRAVSWNGEPTLLVHCYISGSISPTLQRKAQMCQQSVFCAGSHSFTPFGFTNKIMPNFTSALS